MKKIVYILFGVVVLYGVYFYFRNRTVVDDTSKSTSKAASVAETSNTKVVPTKPDAKGVILLADRARYENLSDTEKSFVDKIFKKYALDENVMEGGALLKYFNDSFALVGIPSGKGLTSIDFYSLNNFQRLDEKKSMTKWNMMYEDSAYLIEIGDGGIKYYKAGDDSITDIPDSAVTAGVQFAKNQTYRKEGEIQESYDVAFDKSTKTLTLGVFKPDGSNGAVNTKVGERKFILK